MSKNKYTHLQALEGEILAMREMGLTRQEIAERLGLSKVQIKNWINRYNGKQTKLAAGILPSPKGRRRKEAKFVSKEAELAYELRRLQMENKLLRDFLQCTERK